MINCEQLTKTFDQSVTALDDLSLDIKEKSFTALQGPSGSGKTTLLYCLSGLLRPTSGTVKIQGTSLYEISEAQRTKLRAENIGMIFQNFHLLPYLNVMENVILPIHNESIDTQVAMERANELMEIVDLKHRLSHHPSKLSAGECQRVAFARAILTEPKILLADEPTGNLDNENSDIILNLLKYYADQGNTVVMVTHSDHAAAQTDAIIKIRAGKLAL